MDCSPVGIERGVKILLVVAVYQGMACPSLEWCPRSFPYPFALTLLRCLVLIALPSPIGNRSQLIFLFLVQDFKITSDGGRRGVFSDLGVLPFGVNVASNSSGVPGVGVRSGVRGIDTSSDSEYKWRGTGLRFTDVKLRGEAS